MNKTLRFFCIPTFLLVAAGGYSAIHAQTAKVLENNQTSVLSGQSGLLDPSRFSVRHGLNFGMSSTGGSGVKSQSLYTTMLQYKFNAPITLNLNFGFPLHSSYASGMNLNEENVTSAEYFRSLPLDFSLTWQPWQNTLMRIHVERNTAPQFQPRRITPFMSDRIFESW